MASTVKEKIVVSELSKFGFKVGQEYVNYSKKLPEADKTKVVPGAEFEAELFVADSGKRYLNKILASVAAAGVATPAVAPVVDAERAKRFTPKFQKKDSTDSSMSKEEWAAKDQRISRQGVIQAAVIALAPVVSLEKLEGEAVKLATAMLSFVNGK